MSFARRSVAFSLFAASIMLVSTFLVSPASADAGFQKWIAEFRGVAAGNGVSPQVYDSAFAGVTSPDPEVLRKARYQPEFTQEIWDYIDPRVNEYKAGIGRQMLRQWKPWLDRIEARYGVDRHILLAIWSMESNYGAILERRDSLHYLPRALATLGYADRRRAKFARQQLIAGLKILQKGHMRREQLTGSWAGAMGHTQFIPTSYLAYAVDMDGNGHADIWNSVPDALATAANLLAKNGWQTGKTWGYEVRFPGGVSHKSVAGQTRTLGQWQQAGFLRTNGKGFPRPGDRAELYAPAGANGPAFLMTRNFFILKRYNNADKYALAVGLLADQIAGYGGLSRDWPRPAGALALDEKFEMQKRLSALGYYEGEIDGNLGSGSRAAVQRFQERVGMKPDGVPSKNVLDALRGN